MFERPEIELRSNVLDPLNGMHDPLFPIHNALSNPSRLAPSQTLFEGYLAVTLRYGHSYPLSMCWRFSRTKFINTCS